MGTQLSEWTEGDWMDDYRKKGEHVALVDLAGGKVDGARWLGAQKFVTAENNRRHMEPIRAAGKARGIAIVAVLLSFLSLGLNVWLIVRPAAKTRIELMQPQPLPVYLTNGSVPLSPPKASDNTGALGAEPQKPASE